MPKLAAVLVTYNRLHKLKLAISSILEQDIDYVVVVNNHSSDGSREWLDSLSDPRLRIEHLDSNTGGAGGFYHGCRYACEHLDAEWLLLYDDDAYPAPDLIERFQSLDLSDTQIGAISSAVYKANGEIADFNRPGHNPFRSLGSFIHSMLRGHYLSYDELKSAKGLEVELSSFVGFFVRVQAIKAGLGYPKKDFFIYCDDWTYSLELSLLGYRNLYFADLVFYHDSLTFINDHDSQIWKKYYNYRNSIYFYRKAAGIFFWGILVSKIFKWLLDSRLYKNKHKYLQTLCRAVFDGLSMNPQNPTEPYEPKTHKNLAFYHPSIPCPQSHQDRVSVVMVTYNKYSYIRELLLSFKHLNYDLSLLDIIVVDNASSDDTEAKLKAEFQDFIHIIQTGANLGGSGGFNTGMRYALEHHNNEYIWLLDNDVVVQPEALNWLLYCLKSNPDAAAAGSMILELARPDYISEMGASMDWLKARVRMHRAGEIYNPVEQQKASAVEYCAAASLLKRRSALEKLGLWEEFFIHFDDIDWCLRACKAGLRIYCEPNSIVFHEALSQKQATWIKYYNVRNLLYLYARFQKFLLGLVLAKFILWSLYLKLHGLHENSGMINKAIGDFFCGRKAKQDFPMETYKSFASYIWPSQIRTMIFWDLDNFELFWGYYNNIIIGGNSEIELFLYKLKTKERQAIQDKYPNIRMLNIYSLLWKTLSALLTKSKKPIIFDGAFENHLMLPYPAPKIVVYPSYQSLIE